MFLYLINPKLFWSEEAVLNLMQTLWTEKTEVES